jgi:hypothetical protein
LGVVLLGDESYGCLVNGESFGVGSLGGASFGVGLLGGASCDVDLLGGA